MPKNHRLRFAPSPTGDLHIGGARAALFNWLYARKTGGRFLLRIEDTDTERSTDTALASILDSLRWLGLSWDEEPVRQSERGDIYRAAVERLLADGHAYPCFCTKEELEAERERAAREKADYHYSGKCRTLPPEEVRKRLDAGMPHTVRFTVPAGETSFTDLVHEETTFQNEQIGDFIIARADGSPVYLLGVAVDDADMGITLVMRGDDHISNTPKQIMLMRALGRDIPQFAHLPQVLGMDKKKLSKRHGAASVMEYRRMGFLPEAVVNFIALLGWNPGDDREKMTLDELIDAFSIGNISKKSGVFDLQKLEWLNGQYIHERDVDELVDLARPFFIDKELLTDDEYDARREYVGEVVGLLRERCRLLPDFADLGYYFFRQPKSYEEKGVKKHFKGTGTADRLEYFAEKIESVPDYTVHSLEELTKTTADELEIKWSKLIHPTRLAVSGITYGPGLFDLMVLVGRETVTARMRKAAAFIREGDGQEG